MNETSQEPEGDRIYPPALLDDDDTTVARHGPDSLASLPSRASLVHRAPVRATSISVQTWIAGGLLLGAPLLATLATAIVGAAAIERAERAERVAHEALYTSVLANGAELQRLPFADDGREAIRILSERIEREPDPDVRRAEAGRMVALLVQEAHGARGRQVSSEAALRRQLDETVRVLRRLEQDADEGRRKVEAARSTIPGRLASALGA